MRPLAHEEEKALFLLPASHARPCIRCKGFLRSSCPPRGILDFWSVIQTEFELSPGLRLSLEWRIVRRCRSCLAIPQSLGVEKQMAKRGASLGLRRLVSSRGSSAPYRHGSPVLTFAVREVVTEAHLRVVLLTRAAKSLGPLQALVRLVVHARAGEP